MGKADGLIYRQVMRTLTLLLGLSLTACAALPNQPTVPDQPTLLVADQLEWASPPTIRAVGLDPDTDYTLTLERVSQWNSEASERGSKVYLSDALGTIDTSRQAAKGEEELSPYAPIRTMSYVREPLEGLNPGKLRLTLLGPDEAVLDEIIVTIGADLEVLSEVSFHPDFPGGYIMKRQDASGPRPAIVVLGGSEGGDSGSRSTAPYLAEEGYTVLGLPYYSPAWYGSEAQFPDLPRDFVDIPVDYLEDAVAALRKRDDVDPDHILLMGGSKGAEFVLLAGSLIPDDSPGGGFCAIVADVPTDVVWEGWGQGVESDTRSSFSWRGQPLPFVPYKDMGRTFQDGSDYTMTEAHENGRMDNPDRVMAARIKVEDIDEPVLLIGGDKDTTWASGPMSRSIKAQRDAAGRITHAYIYPDGGHGVGGSPLVRTRPANLEARLENFPATMAFLKDQSKRTDCRE